jgi:hypothetical protein
MSTPDPGLAEHWELMSHPPRLRLGTTTLVPAQAPAAGANFTYPIGNTYWERIVALAAVLTTGSAAGYRQVQANVLSGDGAIINQTQLTPNVGPSTAWSIYADLTGTPSVGTGASAPVTGEVTSPAALTSICTETLPQGSYTVDWQVGLSGTTAAADQNNFGLYVGSTLVATSNNEDTAGGTWPQDEIDVEIPSAGAALRIRSIAAGTSGAIYDASLVATLQSVQASYPQMADLVIKSGWSLQLAVDNIQPADQLGPIYILTERYPSDYASGTLKFDHAEVLRELAAELADRS